eukprot:6456787-Amphidinium_carterae.1
MDTFQDAVPPLMIQMRLRESLPRTTGRQHLESTTFLVDKGRQENRLHVTSQVRFTDKYRGKSALFLDVNAIVARSTGTYLYLPAWRTESVFSFETCLHVSLEPLQLWPFKLLAKARLAYPWTPSETTICWRHTTLTERRTDIRTSPLHQRWRISSMMLQKK